MCGIIAYVGTDEAAPILLEGLERLEYRGYDSAGMAVQNGKGRPRVRHVRDRPHSLGDAR
jgi:glucosamine--fructose-6-phosphate aminotransferase (isomerizing)